MFINNFAQVSRRSLCFSLPKKLVERVQSATKCGDYLWPFTAESVCGAISESGANTVLRLEIQSLFRTEAKTGEGEDEAGGRDQPLSESFCEGAKFCQGHVVSRRF